MSTTVYSNADLIKKFRQKFTTGDFEAGGGLLAPDQQDRFIDLLVDQSVLLKGTTLYRRDNRSGEIYFIDSSGHAIRAAGAEGTEHTTETWGISTKTRSYTAVKTYGHFVMTWEDVKWTVEGPRFEDTVMNLWAKQLSKDWETLALHGDADKYADPNNAYQYLVDIDDGWIEILLNDDDVHVVDVHDNGNPVTISWDIFAKALNALPTKYQSDPGLRWIVSPRLISDYRHSLVGRTDVGSAALQGDIIQPEGIEFYNGIRGVPYMPFNLGDGGNETVLLLCNPKQLAWVVHREFTLYRKFMPERDAWGFWGYGYVDFIVLNPDAVVVVKGLTKDTTYGS